MSLLRKHTYQSSFWLWFVIALAINQILLFSIFYFVLIRPISNSLGQAVGAFAASATMIDQSSDGFQKLQEAATPFQAISFSRDNEPIEKVPHLFMGMRVIQQTLQRAFGERVIVGYAPPPHQALVIRTVEPTPLTMRVSFQGRFFALQVLGFSLLLLVLVSVVASYWISTRLVRPLRDLSDAAVRLTHDRNFQAIETTPGASREMVQLGKTLNQMQSALNGAMKEREALLAGVAHDLRTPLSRMRLALELEGAGNTELVDGLREDIVEMSAVMEQFIELSRLNLEVDESWVVGDLNQLLHGVQAKYRRGGIELSLDLGNALPPIRQKPLALTRLLYNLIDNAYRHGNGDVAIHTGVVDGQVTLTVANPVAADDEGTGLMRAFQEQGSGKTAGLGLSIVRRFAEVHAAELRETTVNGVRKYTLEFHAA